MMTFLYGLGGFLVGLLTMALVVIWINRRAEQEAFRRFWF